MPSGGKRAIRVKHAELHGNRIVYRVAGDPGLPVVLLIHGLTGSGATWEPVMPELARAAHVIAVDLIGHGGSDKPRADYSLGAFATDLRDLLEHLGHDRATVVGHSFGGGVALQFAHQFHERCERLVLVASGGLGREVSWLLQAATLPGSEFVLPVIANNYVVGAGRTAAQLVRWLPFRLRPSAVETLRSYASLADLPARSAFVHTLRSVVEPGGQRVAATNKLYLAAGRPTLIVWGAQDTIIPMSHGEAAHAALPGSQLEIFEQSGHFPHVDEPERFAEVLSQFLQTTQPAIVDREQLRNRLNRNGTGRRATPRGATASDQAAP